MANKNLMSSHREPLLKVTRPVTPHGPTVGRPTPHGAHIRAQRPNYWIKWTMSTPKKPSVMSLGVGQAIKAPFQATKNPYHVTKALLLAQKG